MPVQFSATSQTPAVGRHVVELGSKRSAGQAAPLPVQFSATSQTPALGRQVVELGSNASAGQVAELPVQLSATSQAPALARQVVELGWNASAGQVAELPVQLSTAVQSLERANGRLRLETSTATIEADQVVVATGPFQTPFVPGLADRLAPEVFQTHSVGYRRPQDVPEGTILVVGGGNTGFQIAEELARTRSVHLSIGSRQTPLPQRILGRDLFWWLTTTRLLRLTVESRLGHRLRHRDTLIGSSPRRIRRQGVVLRPRAVDADARRVSFEDGSGLEVDGVIWATGYRPDYSWIRLPVFDEAGRLQHRRGVTDVPGLYFLGLTWQHTRGSALLGWVREDAEHIAGRMAEERRSGTTGEREREGATR